MPSYPKSIRLLLSLNQKERIKFKDYLKSPYFNKRNEVLSKLYNHILREFKTNQKDYCETKLAKKVYGEFNKRKYDFDLQKLREHFERFIAFQHLEENKQQFNQLLLEDYLYRNDGNFFQSKYAQIKKQLEEIPKDIYHYQHLFKVETLFDNYIKLHKDERVNDSNLQAVSDALDQDFLLKKMCYTVIMLNRRDITDFKYNFGLKELALEHFKENGKGKVPLTNLFYYAYEILSNRNIKNAYEKLNLELLKPNLNVTKDMAKVLFMILQNNYKRLENDKEDLYQQIFELCNIMLDKNYIQRKGNISIYFFKNIVSIGLELEKFKYVEDIIDSYKQKLVPKEYAQEVYAYNKAKYLIYTGEAESANELLPKINFDDALFKFDLKCLHIMLNYDLKEFRLLDFSISNLEVALTPNRPPYISSENTLAYRNFVLFVKRINRYRIDPNVIKNEIELLIGLIKQTKQVACKKWLIMRSELLLKEK